MNAIRIHLYGNLHIIVDDKRNVIFSAEFLQIFGFLQKMLLVQFFLPGLNKGHAALQALFYHLMQGAALQPMPVCHRIE